MSTFIVAAVIVALIGTVSALLLSVATKQKDKHMNQLINRFKELGMANNLSFSGQEVLTHWMIGLDGTHRKLLVLTQIDLVSLHYIINLDEVSNCTVVRQYGSIKPGDLSSKKLETFLEKLVLHIELNNGKDPVEISFYNHIDNSIHQLYELEQKAENWKQVLNKMLGPLKKTA